MDVEKVIKGLECCADGCRSECPYHAECERRGGLTDLLRDALALLKEREAEISNLRRWWQNQKNTIQEMRAEQMKVVKRDD